MWDEFILLSGKKLEGLVAYQDLSAMTGAMTGAVKAAIGGNEALFLHAFLTRKEKWEKRTFPIQRARFSFLLLFLIFIIFS